MVDVQLWSGLRRLTGGEQVVRVEGGTVREILRRVIERHPALEPILKANVSVSVNGVIETNHSATVPDDAEVVLFQRGKGC